MLPHRKLQSLLSKSGFYSFSVTYLDDVIRFTFKNSVLSLNNCCIMYVDIPNKYSGRFGCPIEMFVSDVVSQFIKSFYK